MRGKTMLVIDYFSNYPEICLLSNTTSAAVITHMKSIFARHGIPHVLISDNGTPYSSQEFKAFAAQYEFQHITSSPMCPQANGKAEKEAQIVKRLIKKAAHSKTDPYLALMACSAAPLESGRSPAELLMGGGSGHAFPDIVLNRQT
ncbi:hypothetical protein LDENG_00082320 [Lucifuga dentata]|nr:hypothetical protein LDENG_00082320 [Lucifuga dentata]